MDSIGAEVGQKMRSAIKAKLMELGCYVDDELPDYIMVMVANKRTTSQMNEDLQLFLGNKTETFVDWLQIVLKKLKEITVTNPDVYKKVSKHKLDNSPKSAVKVKKEKKEKNKSNKKIKDKKLPKPVIKDIPHIKSLTDDLPVEASKLSEMRKIVVLQENQNSNSNISSIENVNEDSFDIPPLSEVALSNENELAEIEKKIKSVKSRLGLQVASESEDEDFINIKAEPDELFPSETSKQKKDDKASRKIKLLRTASPVHEILENPNKLFEPSTSPKRRNEHPRIIYVNADTHKKLSALERLGKRPNNFELDDSESKRRKISLANIRRQEEEILGIPGVNNDKPLQKQTALVGPDEKRKVEGDNRKGVVRESALKRLGVMSKVALPQKDGTEEEAPVVPSSVKVKPRTMLPLNNQANKNLLLKAVAEAQRSIAQTPVVGAHVKPDALYTKKYKEKVHTVGRKLSNKEKDKIKNILNQSERKDKKELEVSSNEEDDDDDDNLEYIPKPVRKVAKLNEDLEYIPSIKGENNVDFSGDLPKKSKGQTFIITLDGITRCQEQNANAKIKTDENKKRKSPSPIIFDAKIAASVVAKVKQVPERFPAIPLPAIKAKEKCKYWPMCRQGDKCEFIHPTTPCKAFPQCRFGEKCLYIHPPCKFETSCTRKDCPYNHVPKTHANAPLQMCKFYPNCSNTHCTFYHPKMCKYGKYCKNQSECSFSHNFPVRSNFTWRSALKS